MNYKLNYPELRLVIGMKIPRVFCKFYCKMNPRPLFFFFKLNLEKYHAKRSNAQTLKRSNAQTLKRSNAQTLKNSVKNFVKLSSLFLLLNQSAYAVEIIGNLTGTYIISTSLSDTFNKAVSFQMGAAAHTLDNVKIVLTAAVGGGTEASAQTTVQLRSHDGTNTPTTTVIATLNPNPLTGTAYGTTPAPVTFTPASTITLQASTKYWVVARGISTNFLRWSRTNLGVAPTNGAGTYLAHVFTSDGGTNWGAPDTLYNAIQINGTAVSSGIVNAPIDLHFSKQVESYSTEIEVKYRVIPIKR